MAKKSKLPSQADPSRLSPYDEDGEGLHVVIETPKGSRNTAVGCLLSCRIIGVIEGEQGKKKDPERNDRIIAIEQANHSFADIRHVRDLGKQFVRELEDFFVNYHELSGTKYRVLDVRGPGEAEKRIKDGIRAFKKS